MIILLLFQLCCLCLPAYGFDTISSALKSSKRIGDLKKQLFEEFDIPLARSQVQDQQVRIKGLVMELGEQQQRNPVGKKQRYRGAEGKWRILYTTEDEVNVFVKLGLVREGREGAIREITQDLLGGRIDNTIPFQNGGYLAVSGTTVADNTNIMRTNFQFTEAKLSLMWWRGGEPITLPPVGKGWFDTMYIDEDIRCDVNSRNDILVLGRCK